MIEVVTTTLASPPAVGWAAGALRAAQAADREVSRQSALRYRAVAAFALTRPASVDRPQGSAGAMSAERWAARPELLRSVSEWATQELVVALSLSSAAAEALLVRSLTLVHRLPATLDALEVGAVHGGHVTAMLDHVAPVVDDAVRAALEADLLAWARRRGSVCTPARLRDKARREVLKRNARDAAQDFLRAVKRRGLSCRPDACDGMSVVSALLTTPEAAALMAALGAYADALPPDGRTRGQKMADCLLDLVLRPGEHGMAPVQVTLNVVAPVGALLGGDQPCEIDGQVVPAAVVRALLTAITSHRFGADAQTDVAEGTAPAQEPTASSAAEAQPDGAETTAAGHPEDTAPDASTSADDTDPPEPATSGSATSGVSLVKDDPLLGLSDDTIAHYATEARADAAWWAEIERRVATGELYAHLDPAYDEPWPPPGWSPPWGALGLDDPVDLRPDDPPAPDPVPDGWWTRADDAVTAAGSALLAAEQAVGHARRLVATAERADTADEGARADSPAGRVSAAGDAITALATAGEDARLDLADLLDRSAGGGLTDRPRIAVTDALTGTLLALTDLAELRRAERRGAGLAAPGETTGYRPGAVLDRHVRARDRRCRFPGCRRPVPRKGELDHGTPWPAGPTSAANLTGFCTGHHRGKHQAPGWHYRTEDDGTLTVTTPSGLTATTTPPPY